MEKRWIRFSIIFCTLAITTTHLVSANGRFVFSDRNDSDYVEVRKISSSPFKFRFARCHSEGGSCVDFGKKQGYTLEDVRMPVFKLMDKRESGKLSSADSHDLDTLLEIIRGIESPRLNYPRTGYSYEFKGSAEHFIRVINERLGSK